MFRQKAEGLSVKNHDSSDEECLRQYGFSSEDLSCLISPLATTSPIKKKQRSIFTFEEYEEQSDEENDANVTPRRDNYDTDVAVSSAVMDCDLLPTIDENALQKSFQEFALGSFNDSDNDDDDGLLDQSSSTILDFELISPTNGLKSSLEAYPQSGPTYKYFSNINLSLPDHQLGVPIRSTVFDPINYPNNGCDSVESSMIDVILDDYFHPKSSTERQQQQKHHSSSNAAQLYTHDKYAMEVKVNPSTEASGRRIVTAESNARAMEHSAVGKIGVDAGSLTTKDDSARSAKSLATISRKFVEFFGQARTIDYIGGLLPIDSMQDAPLTANRVDGTADSLGVHVRRIYELIKILETLSLVNVRAVAELVLHENIYS